MAPQTETQGDAVKASTNTTSGLAGRREWTALSVLALPCMLVVMDLTVLFLAVPKLAADLDPSSTELLWITDIYGFLIAGTLITMGTLGDRIGRRRVLLTGAAVFGLASLLASASTSAEMLIAARAIQGIAGATIVPSVLAITYAMFQDERQRTRALGVVMSSFAAGGALGPLLGGALLEFFDWNAVFLVNLPVMGLLLWFGPRVLPEFKNPDAGRIDLPSVGLSLVAILATVYGIKEIAREDLQTVSVLAIAVGVTVGAAFARRQKRLADPLLDLSLFRAREFVTALGGNVFGAFAMYGVYLFISQYLQLGLGLSPLEAGLLGLPGIAAMMVTATVLPNVAAGVRPAYQVATGMFVTAIGFAVLAQMGAESGASAIVVGTTIMSIGIAPVTTVGMGLIVGAAPPERSGSASAVAETGNELGGAFGIALLGSVGTAVMGGDVASATRAEFVDAINVAAGVCAAGMLILGVVVALVLRDTSGAPEPVAEAA
jgi:DHA2 family multidrug resistance protein-like MFS transporter